MEKIFIFVAQACAIYGNGIPTPGTQIKFTNHLQRHCCYLGNLAKKENNGFLYTGLGVKFE